MIPTQLVAIGIISERAIANQRCRMRFGRAVTIGPIVSGRVLLNLRAAARDPHMALRFARDVVDRVIALGKGIALSGVWVIAIFTGRACQTIKIIIGVAKAGRPAHFAGLRGCWWAT